MPKLQNIHRLVMVGAFGMAVAVSAAAAQRPEGDDTGQRDDDVPPASYHYGSYEECIEDGMPDNYCALLFPPTPIPTSTPTPTSVASTATPSPTATPTPTATNTPTPSPTPTATNTPTPTPTPTCSVTSLGTFPGSITRTGTGATVATRRTALAATRASIASP